jgi:hypothetical protein
VAVLLAIGGSDRPSLLMPQSASATHQRIRMPFVAGQQWVVSQGYNTSPPQGGSHWNCDPATLKDAISRTAACRAGWQYRFSLDLQRADGRTAGEQVLSPVDGMIRWIDESTGGMSINLGDGYAVAFFHARLAHGLAAGQPVRTGQVLGTVAPAGEANSGGTAHIHLTVWQTTDGGNWSRTAIPFTGATAVDGYDFPDLGAAVRNQHRLTAVSSTNAPLPTGSVGVPPAPVLKAPTTGSSSATSAVTFSWNAVAGASEYQVVLDGSTFGPWITGTTWASGSLAEGSHTWQVRARSSVGTGPLSASWVIKVESSTSSPTALTLSETGGTVGRAITIAGTGFGSGEYVDVRWKSASATPLASVRATAAGSFSTQISIPDAPLGQHAIIVTGRTVTKQVSAPYTVKPSLSRVPTEGAPWTPITITARGFGANEDVRLSWLAEDGIVLGTIRTNGAGTGSITITMPNGKPGWNDYTGYGLTSRARVWGALRILSSVTLTPTSAAPGATVDLVARGFPPGQTAQVTWNKTLTSAGSSLCRGTMATNGTLVCRFTTPAVGAGVYPITVATSGGTALSANLTVTGPPAASIMPTTGAVGTNITITAGGFSPNEPVTINWDNGTSPQTVIASPQGAISVRATVPRLGAGKHALRVQGTSSRKTASTPFTVASTPVAGSSSRVSEGVYSIYATREGLVGGTTSSGHKIVEHDYFVSLPACTPTNCPGDPYWGNMTNCGNKCYVKVINPRTNACRVEPILDTGPWFRVDDWWNTTDQRYLNNLASNPNTLTHGYTGADAARNGLDVGYGIGPNGIGRDDTGTSPGRYPREVGNRSAIDIADGTWYDLGITSDGTGGAVTVHMLWQTGADPAAQAQACGHPLNQRPGQRSEITNPPGTVNPSFTGTQLTPTYSSGSSNGSGSGYVRDGLWSTAWYAQTNPSSGQFIIDYGKVYQLTGVRWGFNVSGYADQFTVQTSTDRMTWSTVGTFGNGSKNTWYGASLNRQGRYVRVSFANPNADIKIGYMAELQLFGSPAQVTNPSGTVNPSFSGTRLTPTYSSGSSNGSGSGYVRDGLWSTAWYAEGYPLTGQFIIDYGKTYRLTGVRWGFNVSGYADQFTVDTSIDRQTWSRVGTFGNGSKNTWYGSVLGRQGRYLRVSFANPNADAKIGYMAEIQLYGTSEPAPMAGSNPQFSGAPLPIVASAGSAGTNAPNRSHDGNPNSSWATIQTTTPAQAILTLDLGRSQPLTGIRWMYRISGSADQMRLQISPDGTTWTQLVTTSNRAAGTWEGWRTTASARYVRLVFDNPNGDAALGYVAEVEVWGPTSSFSAARAMPAPDRQEPDIAATPVAGIPPATPINEVPAGTPVSEIEKQESAATPLPAQDSATPLPGNPDDDAAATPIPDEAASEDEETNDARDATPVGVEDTSTTPLPTDVPARDATSKPATGDEPTASPIPSTEVGEEDRESGSESDPTGGTDVATPTEPPTTEIVAQETPAAPTDPVVTGTGYVAFTDGDGVNCRAAPGQDGAIIRLLPEGAEIETVGESIDGWQQVICDGQDGFVFAEFISGTPPEEATEPIETAESTESEDEPDLTTPEIQEEEEQEQDQVETPEGSDEQLDPTDAPPDDTPVPVPTAVPTTEPTPEPTAVPTAVPELVTREVVIVSAADTSVTEADPSAAQPPDAVLSLPAGGGDGALAVITFPIEGVSSGTVVDAQLVITGAGETGGSGGQLRVVEGVWFDEGSATWNDAANAGGWNATWIDRIEPGGEAVVDVTGIVTGDGTVSFIIEGTPDQQIAIASTESGTPAYLVITIEEWITPDPE